MLTQGEDVEVHALHQRGWTISAIARHLERDRKTVRAYIRGERRPGVRRRSTPDVLGAFGRRWANRYQKVPASLPFKSYRLADVEMTAYEVDAAVAAAITRTRSDPRWPADPGVQLCVSRHLLTPAMWEASSVPHASSPCT
jgi:hypothetical protein